MGTHKINCKLEAKLISIKQKILNRAAYFHEDNIFVEQCYSKLEGCGKNLLHL